jgi:hypothetical protein
MDVQKGQGLTLSCLFFFSMDENCVNDEAR